MQKLSLCGTWRMVGGDFDVTGRIPGSLYSFLLDAGLMDDPYYRDNEFAALELTRNDYTFTRDFHFTKGNDTYLLRFEGLDTLCDVYLNGVHVGKTINMHVTYEFDVTPLLRNGQNTLSVVCHEIHTYMKEHCAVRDLYPNIQALAGFGYLRKAYCMSGWDWGPFLPDMGIWRDVSLLTKDSARITEVKIVQRHENGRVFITPVLKSDMPADTLVTLTSPDGAICEIDANKEYEIENPALWWPHGLGEQPLYTVSFALVDGAHVERIEVSDLTAPDFELTKNNVFISGCTEYKNNVYLLFFRMNMWQLFLVVIPAELVVFFSFRIGGRSRKKNKKHKKTDAG